MKANQNNFGIVVSYLLVTAVALRGLMAHPEVRFQLAGLLTLFALTTLLEPQLRKLTTWIQPVFVISQIVVMVGLFLLDPLGDYWAIMLMPTCIYVTRYFRQLVARFWLGVFVFVMGIMIIYGYGVSTAPQYIIVYLAAYLLVTAYALMFKQMQAAQQESQLLLQKLQATNAQLEEYVIQVEELTVMKERNRLARELHDAVTQSIFSMTLIARSALILQERDPQQVTEKLHQLQELAQGALQEMRGLIYQLRTLTVAEDGLYPVLQKFVDGLNERNTLQVTLGPVPKSLPLSPIQQQELYRIIQEALNNTVKHAQAKTATIQFDQKGENVLVTIRDNGVGFDPKRPNVDRTHIGLASMRERAQELGGSLSFHSQPGTGTELIVTITVEKQRNSHE